MGPYCKFCNTRCFVPTSENERIKSDLKATCKKGMEFDLKVTELEELEQLHETEITEAHQMRLNELANEVEIIRSKF